MKEREATTKKMSKIWLLCAPSIFCSNLTAFRSVGGMIESDMTFKYFIRRLKCFWMFNHVVECKETRITTYIKYLSTFFASLPNYYFKLQHKSIRTMSTESVFLVHPLLKFVFMKRNRETVVREMTKVRRKRNIQSHVSFLT